MHRRINNFEKGVNRVSKVKPPRPPPTPTPAERTSPTGCYETAGPATGTSTNHAKIEVCNLRRSKNPMHTIAVKMMTCMADECGMCGKRGHIKENCFNNPDSPWNRPQGSKPAQPQPKQAVNAIISKHNSARMKILVKQEEKELGPGKVLLDRRANISLMNTLLALKIGLKTEDLEVSPSNQVTTATNDLIRLTGKARPTIRGKEGKETEFTVYTSQDVVQDLLFVSRNAMIEMGILHTPSLEEDEKLEDKDGLIRNTPPLE